MNPRHSFRRKVGYIIAIILLLVPMSLLSMPASRSGRDGRLQGGKLAELRNTHQLSPANLGEIDPASETMKLATLGMRGIAANILWEKAHDYKKHEDWTNFAATLDQITKLQPNFISVWQHQAWNLSYNLSVEFDDYHDRYMYVIRGINFLKEGLKYNADEPRLLWDVGWFIGHKIGRADEYRQYRRLFKADDDFHAGSGRTKEERDNWRVAKHWFEEAVRADARPDKRMKGKSQLIVKSDPGMASINYADAIQEEGTHGEVAEGAWRAAAKEWDLYGQESILTSYGLRIHLNDQERLEADVKGYLEKLESLSSKSRVQLEGERFAQLPAEMQEAYDLPYEKRTNAQNDLAREAGKRIKVTHLDIAAHVRESSPENAKEATRLAYAASEAERVADIIDRYRSTVNFNYWRRRCQFELTPQALEARELAFRATQALNVDADAVTAKQLFDQSFAKWDEVLKLFPGFEGEGTTGEDLVDVIKIYARVLEELDEKLPKEFPLRRIIQTYDRDGDVKHLLEGDEVPVDAEPAGKTPVDEAKSKPTDGDSIPGPPEPALEASDVNAKPVPGPPEPPPEAPILSKPKTS